MQAHNVIFKELKDRNVNIKMSQSQFDAIMTLASKYSKGNISAWMRYASMNVPAEIRDQGTLVLKEVVVKNENVQSTS